MPGFSTEKKEISTTPEVFYKPVAVDIVEKGLFQERIAYFIDISRPHSYQHIILCAIF